LVGLNVSDVLAFAAEYFPVHRHHLFGRSTALALSSAARSAPCLLVDSTRGCFIPAELDSSISTTRRNDAQGQTWPEIAGKVATLVGALPHDPLPGWLNRLRESFADDVMALAALPVQVAEAAE